MELDELDETLPQSSSSPPGGMEWLWGPWGIALLCIVAAFVWSKLQREPETCHITPTLPRQT